jgi:retinol dehydrogenase-14
MTTPRSTGLMAGSTVLITGGTGGIGKATALGLATLGAHVAITGRDRDRTEAAAREIRAAGGGQVDVFVADLSSQSQLRGLAEEVLQCLPWIDVLVNNVGGFWNTRHVTEDGHERTFALNHLAPFLLTNLLLERIQHSTAARVVTVSSNAQAMGRIDFDNLQGDRSYSGARAYNQSKLANVLFTYELARRLHATTVTANALHPGVVRTGFGAEDPAIVQRFLIPMVRPFMKAPPRAPRHASTWRPPRNSDTSAGATSQTAKKRNLPNGPTTRHSPRNSGASASNSSTSPTLITARRWTLSPDQLSKGCSGRAELRRRLYLSGGEPFDEATLDQPAAKTADKIMGVGRPPAVRRGRPVRTSRSPCLIAFEGRTCRTLARQPVGSGRAITVPGALPYRPGHAFLGS